MNEVYQNSKKELIESIRKEKGIGIANTNESRKTIESLQSDLKDAIKNLSDGLYKKDFHFVMELIQNADDNKYHSKKKPKIQFRISDSEILVQNNEIGFQEEHVRTICKVGKSTKSKIEGYIGEKGIGFKSVFKITDEPMIISNGFQFKFNSNLRKRSIKLGYILPEWVDDLLYDTEEELTNIFLPFKKNTCFKYIINSSFTFLNVCSRKIINSLSTGFFI